MIKIAIIGAHGVGKTTMIENVKTELESKGLRVRVVAETARECPLPINRPESIRSLMESTFAQMWILAEQLKREIEASLVEDEASANTADVMLCDRSIIDIAAYFESIFNETYSEGLACAAHWLVEAWYLTYQRIFLIPPTIAPVADGVRDTDPAWQAEIHERINHIAERYAIELEEIKHDDARYVAGVIMGLRS